MFDRPHGSKIIKSITLDLKMVNSYKIEDITTAHVQRLPKNAIKILHPKENRSVFILYFRDLEKKKHKSSIQIEDKIHRLIFNR